MGNKEQTVGKTNTTTQVETSPQTTVENEDYDYIVRPALFIKFAEYLGYVSEMLPWCDKLCDGEDIEPYKKKFIEVEAKMMYNEMLKELTPKAIKEYYETFYEVILYEWEDNLMEIEKKSK